MTGSVHVRIGSVVPGSPPLDVLVDGHPVLAGVEFGGVTDYTDHRADGYAVGVRPAGGDEALPEASVAFEAGRHYTRLLVGTPDDVSLRLPGDGP